MAYQTARAGGFGVWIVGVSIYVWDGIAVERPDTNIGLLRSDSNKEEIAREVKAVDAVMMLAT